MGSVVAWITCSIFFSLTFILETGFFLYKLINARNVDQEGAANITISSCEVIWYMGWIWKYAVDKSTNQMKLSIFIIWYIVSLSLCLLSAVALFFSISSIPF